MKENERLVMSGKVRIEKLNADHRDCWMRLWGLYLEFYETTRSEEIFNLSFERLIDPDFNECEGFLALSDGQGVGMVNCLYHIHLWQKQKICYLQDLFVDNTVRKQGIGGRLIRRVYERTDELGYQGVYWTTQDFNLEARKLYDKIGVKTPFIKYARS